MKIQAGRIEAAAIFVLLTVAAAGLLFIIAYVVAVSQPPTYEDRPVTTQCHVIIRHNSWVWNAQTFCKNEVLSGSDQ